VTPGDRSASPRRRHADGLEEPFGREVLEQEPARPGAKGLIDALVEVERREHHHAREWDLRIGRGSKDAAGCLDPVHARHPNVHEDNVGPRLLADPDGFGAIVSGAGDDHVGLRRE